MKFLINMSMTLCLLVGVGYSADANPHNVGDLAEQEQRACVPSQKKSVIFQKERGANSDQKHQEFLSYVHPKQFPVNAFVSLTSSTFDNIPHTTKVIFLPVVVLKEIQMPVSFGPVLDLIQPCEDLENLIIQRKNLTGQIPESIQRFKKLTEINLDFCSLTEAVPSSIQSLENLGLLSLQNTKISNLPPEIFVLPNLCYLNIKNTPIKILDAHKLTSKGPDIVVESEGCLFHTCVISRENGWRSLVMNTIDWDIQSIEAYADLMKLWDVVANVRLRSDDGCTTIKFKNVVANMTLKNYIKNPQFTVKVYHNMYDDYLKKLTSHGFKDEFLSDLRSIQRHKP